MLKLAVIGDPIEHSFSPQVHGAALDALGVAYTYQKVRVPAGGLADFLPYARAEGIEGFNLTMPHKVDILPFLDEIDEEAQRFSSVNTVVVRDGRLCGFNTDADGYTAALRTAGHAMGGKRVLILGAGGVVRTLALKAAYEGAARIVILNRTADKAEAVCDLVRQKVPAELRADTLGMETLCAYAADCDVLIQATPLGMHGTGSDFTDFSFLDRMHPDALVSDLIYNPERTRLLQAASARGLAVQNGLGMLICQALLADRIYTGLDFKMEDLYPIVADTLRQKR